MTGAPEPLTSAELAALRQAGSLNHPMPAPADRASIRTRARTRQLLTAALTVDQAAARLGLTPTQVGDLLARGALYGVVVAGTWRLPLFQFTGTGVLPGLDQVVPALPEGLHPLAVANWFTGANVDLDTGSGPVSPLDWLTAGGDPAPVARLASALRVSG